MSARPKAAVFDWGGVMTVPMSAVAGSFVVPGVDPAEMREAFATVMAHDDPNSAGRKWSAARSRWSSEYSGVRLASGVRNEVAPYAQPMRAHQCLSAVRTTLIRNVAARGRAATFVLRIDSPVEGSVEVRHGPFPYFLLASRSEIPLVDGLEVRRGFFDASFELAVTSASDVRVRVE